MNIIEKEIEEFRKEFSKWGFIEPMVSAIRRGCKEGTYGKDVVENFLRSSLTRAVSEQKEKDAKIAEEDGLEFVENEGVRMGFSTTPPDARRIAKAIRNQ